MDSATTERSDRIYRVKTAPPVVITKWYLVEAKSPEEARQKYERGESVLEYGCEVEESEELLEMLSWEEPQEPVEITDPNEVAHARQVIARQT
jgi:hypothetical protein